MRVGSGSATTSAQPRSSLRSILVPGISPDGGILGEVPRDSTANDAAALAAAYSCATGEGLAGAETAADDIAAANVSDAVSTSPEPTRRDAVEGGQVTVHFGGEQT